ncbi:MAG: DUF3604 domain-containing protein [Gammaproteobacteria bacterium]|nr:DUF3604 domain-containing protein [Gammaproteobacteria bacterium]MDE0367429.1 DUF3604 domain-containing protein [Gammaproteobacteria bacterium]
MKKAIYWAGLLLIAAACSERPPTAEPGSGTAALSEEASSGAAAGKRAVESNPLRNAYFGDTHIHTVLSVDAYLMGTRRTPDDAYEFARGAAIEHASGFMMQMKKPLDFLAVSDHGFYLGMMRELDDENSPYALHPLVPAVRAADTAEGSIAAFQALIDHLRNRQEDPALEDDLDDRGVARSAWQEIIESAERHNDPGSFTTFIGYEYTTSGPEFQNLHRNVIFRGSKVPLQPFSRLDSLNPEDLWAWMDTNRANGMEAIAIPHNPNGSDGWMFANTDWAGEPMDANYAETRMRNEPLVENTQVKGTSDTHPLLSPNDEWANFELMELKVASDQPSRAPGSYVREAWLNGMAMEDRGGFNPYRFGVIGASDTHNAAGSFEEDNYWSKTGLIDIEPHMRGSVPLPDSSPGNPEYAQGASQYWGASGLAGVWAESNTRDDIFDAFRRKETFSTSGPHIKVRFFAGFDIDESLLAAPDAIAQAYAKGVPMGADLPADGERAPRFLAWAARDADTVALQRLQIIKGWVEDGGTHEAVIDIACSDGGTVDPATQRCPDNGATVNLGTCSVSADKGAAELKAVWQDPNFDPAQRAFYYVRVLENPKCRWSTWDAIRAGVAPRPDMQATIQDRAWSSPIWYRP